MAMKAASPASKKDGLKTKQPDVGHPSLRKTKLCSFFQEDRCRRGDACGFAHSLSELGNAPDLTKTSICLGWKEGRCPNSSKTCRFAHGKNDLRGLRISPTKLERGQDNSMGLLAKPPGLQVPSSLATAPVPEKIDAPPIWMSGLQPMKVSLSFLKPKTEKVMEPMKVIPFGEDSLFGHWESETTAEERESYGESSSDDDGSHSSMPVPSMILQADSPSWINSGFTPSSSPKGTLDLVSMLAATGALDEDKWLGDVVPKKLDLSLLVPEDESGTAPGGGTCYDTAATESLRDGPFGMYSPIGGMPPGLY